MQSIQLKGFSKNRFYVLWSSQRQSASVGVNYKIITKKTILEKVRKIRDVAFQDDRRRSDKVTGMKSAKSYTDLSKL